MTDLLDFLTEAKTGGKDSGSKPVEAEKSRVRIFNFIMDALKKTHVGEMWSTKGSGRNYVTTLDTHGGTSPDQKVGNKIAKGFTGGTFKSVKDFAMRTIVRHGKRREKKFEGKPYWKSKRKAA